MTVDVLLPPGAEPLAARGAFELAVQHCTTRILLDLGAGTGGHPDAQRYRLPAAATWPDVLGFYTAHLAPGWRRVDAPQEQDGYRVARWRRRRVLRTEHLAVALLDDPVDTGDGPPFRVLVVAVEPR